MTKTATELIKDGDTLVSAKRKGSEYSIPVYDDGFGPLFIHRNSMGISGIVRAQTWEDAYSICEDEFFPDATETMEEIVKEYGYREESHKVVKDSSVLVASEHCSAGERFAVYPDDYPDGKLAPEFVRWATVKTIDPDAWSENACFQESFGFRNNGGGNGGNNKNSIYAKDLNGDSLDRLTPELLEEFDIELTIKSEDDTESE